MTLPTLNGTARLIEDPELRFGASGGAIVKVRLAFNSRKKDASGEWQDDASFFVTGTAFGQAAENIAETLQRATEVVVSGRLKTDSWEKDGQRQSRTELLIDSMGPSLRFATAKVTKTTGNGQARGQGGGWGNGGSASGGQHAPSDDPWASQPAGGGYSDAPPF